MKSMAIHAARVVNRVYFIINKREKSDISTFHMVLIIQLV